MTTIARDVGAPLRARRFTVLDDERVAIRFGASLEILNAAEILSIHAEGNFTRIAARGGDVRVHEPLYEVLGALHRFGVLKIHRGAAVNLAHVRRVVSRGRHRVAVVLEGGDELAVGRAFQAALRGSFGILRPE